MKNVNMEKIKDIWSDLHLIEEIAVMNIAKELEKAPTEELGPLEREFIRFKENGDLSAIKLLNKLGDKYGFTF